MQEERLRLTSLEVDFAFFAEFVAFDDVSDCLAPIASQRFVEAEAIREVDDVGQFVVVNFVRNRRAEQQPENQAVEFVEIFVRAGFVLQVAVEIDDALLFDDFERAGLVGLKLISMTETNTSEL